MTFHGVLASATGVTVPSAVVQGLPELPKTMDVTLPTCPGDPVALNRLPLTGRTGHVIGIYPSWKTMSAEFAPKTAGVVGPTVHATGAAIAGVTAMFRAAAAAPPSRRILLMNVRISTRYPFAFS
ncbi:hypothetical protein ACIOEW_08400 [Streptomyces sp. NPDC087901]|uniref:hypothetical protein n=1 Tax=Streptomyces sp. NPDC087901 TaxID=3365818 RepID=UPI0038261ECD